MFRVKLINVFHNTECWVMSDSKSPSVTWMDIQCKANEWNGQYNHKRKLKRIENALCGIEGCTCGTFRPK